MKSNQLLFALLALFAIFAIVACDDDDASPDDEQTEGPVPDFEASSTTIDPGETVSFTDLSEDGPESWSWTFEGGSPSSSDEQHPEVTYEEPGEFTVKLVVSNEEGENELEREGYITVNDPMDIEQNQQVMVNKFTATWCNNCGTWGWDLMDDILANFRDDALIISTYSSRGDEHIWTPVSHELWDAIRGTTSGIPAFFANGVDHTERPPSGGISPPGTFDNIEATIEASKSELAEIRLGLQVEKNGQEWTVNAAAKAQEDLEGHYRLGAYVIEDQVVKYQNQRGSFASHKNVLRIAADNQTFGRTLFSGAAETGESFEESYTLTIDEDWNPDNIKIALMVWKETAGSYEFIHSVH